MPTRQVTIQGYMTWDEPGVNIPVFPSNPIAPGGTTPPWGIPLPPGQGGVPTHPIYNPPSIWPNPGQPTHPIAGQPPNIWPSPGQPTHPIYNPPFPSQGPGFPTPPIYYPPPENIEGGVTNPIGGAPMPGGAFVLYYSPVHGWYLVPANPGTRPDNTLPEPEGK
jgi:hypothetical protein